MFAEALTELGEQDSPRAFPATRWSLVLGVQEGEAQTGKEALAKLCQMYWQPLYAYARRSGNSPQDAEDLTQGFFVHLITKEALHVADPKQGRLRSFLLTSLKRFMRDQWRASQRVRRGGRQQFVSIDQEEGEPKYQAQMVDGITPEVMYDRLWVYALLDQVIASLKEECERNGKAALFEVVRPFLFYQTDEASSYEAAATTLDLTVAGVRTAVHRLRKRFRERLLDCVADTLPSRDGLAEEVAFLMQTFQGQAGAAS